MSLTTRVLVNISAEHTKPIGERSVMDSLALPMQMNLANGTGAGKASKVFFSERSLADGGTEDLDLSGTLVDGFGDAVVFTKVRLIAIKSDEANTTTLSVGGDAAGLASIFGAANDIIKVGPGGFFALGNPSLAAFAVTATTADILQVANSAGAIANYTIMVVGE